MQISHAWAALSLCPQGTAERRQEAMEKEEKFQKVTLDLTFKISMTCKTPSSYSSASSPTNPDQLWILTHSVLGVRLQTITSVFPSVQGPQSWLRISVNETTSEKYGCLCPTYIN